MPRVNLDNLPDDSRIWVFGLSPRLDSEKREVLLSTTDRFLDQWAAHNMPITSARAVIDGSFFVVAVDRESETSGCSIDRMFGLLRDLETRLGIAILDPNRVFVRHGDGQIEALTRAEFRERGDKHTHVFDTLVERLGDVRQGRWEKTAAESWHARLLG